MDLATQDESVHSLIIDRDVVTTTQSSTDNDCVVILGLEGVGKKELVRTLEEVHNRFVNSGSNGSASDHNNVVVAASPDDPDRITAGATSPETATTNTISLSRKFIFCDSFEEEDVVRLTKHAKALILCFSLLDRMSFERVKQFQNIYKQRDPGVPILLVSTKSDLKTIIFSQNANKKNNTSNNNESAEERAVLRPLSRLSSMLSTTSSSNNSNVLMSSSLADLDHVPDEILLNIFSYCDMDTLRAASCACRSFNRHASDNELWKPFYCALKGIKFSRINEFLIKMSDTASNTSNSDDDSSEELMVGYAPPPKQPSIPHNHFKMLTMDMIWTFVTLSEATALSTEIGAADFIEFSAKTKTNAERIYDAIADILQRPSVPAVDEFAIGYIDEPDASEPVSEEQKKMMDETSINFEIVVEPPEGVDGEEDIYTDEELEEQSFERKIQIFREKLNRLVNPATAYLPFIMVLRRDETIFRAAKKYFETSCNPSGRSRNAENLRRPLFVFFDQETGVDRGGIAREFYQIMSEKILDENNALFTKVESMNTYHVNPSSSINEAHLEYFRFIGQLIGKAIFDDQRMNLHFTRPIFKAMLGRAIIYDDFRFVDPSLSMSMEKIRACPSVADMDLSFAAEIYAFGSTSIHCLKKKNPTTVYRRDDDHDADDTLSSDHEDSCEEEREEHYNNVDDVPCDVVDEDNKLEFIELFSRWRIVDSVRKQLEAMLSGLYEAIPRPYLRIFDERELELLLCGTPKIDVQDWKNNTNYEGDFRIYNSNDSSSNTRQNLQRQQTTTATATATTTTAGSEHKDAAAIVRLVEWFWDVVEEMSDVDRGKLLQYVTGTSLVPPLGFAAIRPPFTITSLGACSNSSFLPCAHTCINRLDLPMYDSKEQLKHKLNTAMQMQLFGFGIE